MLLLNGGKCCSNFHYQKMTRLSSKEWFGNSHTSKYNEDSIGSSREAKTQHYHKVMSEISIMVLTYRYTTHRGLIVGTY